MKAASGTASEVAASTDLGTRDPAAVGAANASTSASVPKVVVVQASAHPADRNEPAVEAGVAGRAVRKAGPRGSGGSTATSAAPPAASGKPELYDNPYR